MTSSISVSLYWTSNLLELNVQNEIMIQQANNTSISGGHFNVNTISTAEEGVWLLRFPQRVPAIPKDCPR